jgi:hypothetical protein
MSPFSLFKGVTGRLEAAEGYLRQLLLDNRAGQADISQSARALQHQREKGRPRRDSCVSKWQDNGEMKILL